MKKEKIVTIGGGSGSFRILSGLRKLPFQISAIVSMADSGGSTGVLRNELNVLPPGDVRQCLIALSNADQEIKDLFGFRYSESFLAGHNFGNLILATLEKTTGSFDKALSAVSEILKVEGEVIPITLDNVNIEVVLKNGEKIFKEHNIHKADLNGLKNIRLKPRAKLNPKAKKAIQNADKIIINPGAVYSSIIPHFLVEGMAEELRKTKAKIIYVPNLINSEYHTKDYTANDYVKLIEKYVGKGVIDYVIYNNKKITPSILNKYGRDKEHWAPPGDLVKRKDFKLIGADLLTKNFPERQAGDKILRTLIRHDEGRLAKIISKI